MKGLFVIFSTMHKNKKLSYLIKAVLAVFVFQIILPFFATYDVPVKNPASEKEISSIFGDKILLCTADGFKFVSWQDLQNGTAPKPHSDIKCPLCYVTVNGLKATAPAGQITEVYVPNITSSDAHSNYDYLPASEYFHSKLKSRAPPISLIV